MYLVQVTTCVASRQADNDLAHLSDHYGPYWTFHQAAVKAVEAAAEARETFESGRWEEYYDKFNLESQEEGYVGDETEERMWHDRVPEEESKEWKRLGKDCYKWYDPECEGSNWDEIR